MGAYVNTLSKLVLIGTSQTYVDKGTLRFQGLYFDIQGKQLPVQNIVTPCFETNLYRVEIPIPNGINVARVVLLANNSFVPRVLGINSDERELVLQYPRSVLAE